MTTDLATGAVAPGAARAPWMWTRLVPLGIGLFLSGSSVRAGVLTAAHLAEFPVSYQALERGLLVDASDGALDRFDLVSGGLIASGATDPVQFKDRERRFRHLQQHVLLSVPYLMQSERTALELFQYLHRRVLRTYENGPVTVLDIWDRGAYNCITASWLFLVLARQYDLPAHVVETPFHAFVKLETRPPIPIEMTLSEVGFDFTPSPEDVTRLLADFDLPALSPADEPDAEVIYKSYLARQHPLTPVQVLAVLYYNRALADYLEDRPEAAFRNALAAHLLHEDDLRYANLTRSLGVSWAETLRIRGQSEASSTVAVFLAELTAIR